MSFCDRASGARIGIGGSWKKIRCKKLEDLPQDSDTMAFRIRWALVALLLAPALCKTIEENIKDLKGDDHRVFRWGVTENTAKFQESGACEDLGKAVAANLADPTVLEYVTWCVTNNPEQRAVFAEKANHATVVAQLKTSPALAAHVIYITTYTNTKNHQAYLKAKAPEALIEILKTTQNSYDFMWAAAALQNLEASYCATEDDGCCYWDWDEGHSLEIAEWSLPLESDGSAARLLAAKDEALLKRLEEIVCRGPIQGKETPENPFPGSTSDAKAVLNHRNMETWAATAVLQNMAMTKQAKLSDEVIACACHLINSEEWLEAAKAETLLHHVRPGGEPCWFEDEGLCVDRFFVDEAGYSCKDYIEPEEGDCDAVDASGVKASEACCGCGGGHRSAYPNDEL